MSVTRSTLRAILVSACVSIVVLLANPVSAVWATTEQLDPRGAGELWWIVLTVALIAPLLGGAVGGFAFGSGDQKYYKPLLRGGACAAGGLLVGVVLWAGAGGVVHSPEVMFASLILALCFVVLGGPLAFLVGGLTSKRVAWG